MGFSSRTYSLCFMNTLSIWNQISRKGNVLVLILTFIRFNQLYSNIHWSLCSFNPVWLIMLSMDFSPLNYTDSRDFYIYQVGKIKCWSSKYASLLSGIEIDDYGARKDIDSRFYTSVSMAFLLYNIRFSLDHHITL